MSSKPLQPLGLRRPASSVLALSISLLLGGCALTPDPLSQRERNTTIAEDKSVLFAQQEPVSAPLTLYQAMARALKYNLDHRVKMMERAVSEGQATLARLDLLPEVVASAGYSNRDKFNASNSRSMYTGRQSLETSTSQDRTRYLGNLGLRWNILDFGVSYFRAQQEGNKALASEENRRKVSHNLMQDVRSAYWRAVSAQRMEAKIVPVLEEAQRALKLARQAEVEKLRTPLDSLRYQKSLLEIIRRLEGLLEQQQMAKSELAGLINLPLSQEWRLAEPEHGATPAIPAPALTVGRMEELALQLRPELREEMYQTRISVAEVHKAMLRLLPGVELNLGGHYDSNSYLLNQNWAELGAQMSKNLFEILTAPQSIAAAEAQESLAHSKRLSAYMAILTQVHVANQQFAMAEKQFQRTAELDDLNQKIHQHIINSAENEALSPLERIRTATDSVLSQLQRNQSYAELQNALGKLYVSLGFDPLPETVADSSVEALANAIQTVDQAWADGHYPETAAGDPKPEPSEPGHGEKETAATEATPTVEAPAADNSGLADSLANLSESLGQTGDQLYALSAALVPNPAEESAPSPATAVNLAQNQAESGDSEAAKP